MKDSGRAGKRPARAGGKATDPDRAGDSRKRQGKSPGGAARSRTRGAAGAAPPTDATAGTGAASAGATSAGVGAAAYLYGIVRWPADWADSAEAATRALGAGVGEPPRPVELIAHGSLAALVSRVHAAAIGSAQGVRGLRRDMRAHANVLNRAVALGASLLPAQFGLILPDGRLLGPGFLEPRHRLLDAHLARLDDAVEVTLKAVYVEQQAIQDVVAESPELARRVGAGGQSYQAKLELGRRVAEALRAKRDRDARAVLGVLAPAARDVKVGDPGAELVVLNASFLVPRGAMAAFDKALERVNAWGRGRIQLDCVGPLPPYSFVDLRL